MSQSGLLTLLALWTMVTCCLSAEVPSQGAPNSETRQLKLIAASATDAIAVNGDLILIVQEEKTAPWGVSNRQIHRHWSVFREDGKQLVAIDRSTTTSVYLVKAWRTADNQIGFCYVNKSFKGLGYESRIETRRTGSSSREIVGTIPNHSRVVDYSDDEHSYLSIHDDGSQVQKDGEEIHKSAGRVLDARFREDDIELLVQENGSLLFRSVLKGLPDRPLPLSLEGGIELEAQGEFGEIVDSCNIYLSRTGGTFVLDSDGSELYSSLDVLRARESLVVGSGHLEPGYADRIKKVINLDHRDYIITKNGLLFTSESRSGGD